MAGAIGIHASGLRELDRAFKEIDREQQKQLRGELKDVGEGVRSAAEQLATSSISNIGVPWSLMRVGAYGGRGAMVYVAPKSRKGKGSRRPNLSPLLLEVALLPALDQNRDEAERRLRNMIDRIADSAGF